ncbi:hypothetical protein I317_05245 [Kwoniella heveanensis CBS 569]|uniref:Uncharacterized protein n=1 Tax=Kwoniella heveanensis BCC8398 TaxID=1296120 RepID=A0A1B9GX51_9TREE|nr:hypothetical protein I316_02666 [Kwoniella heveanensis BCC8398]OCF40967.1 hypothetical protein I317_05245 [Kwoniella heveanensis CBS 569]
MARTKKATRRGGVPSKAAPASQPSSGSVDPASLLEKAHILLGQSNFELAIKFLDRVLELEPTNLEARELAGVAELEGGDDEQGRAHLLQLLPPHVPEPPSHPSPYLYLAQTAQDPQEALGYYSTATAMLEQRIAVKDRKGKGKQQGDAADAGLELEEEDEEVRMAVTALVAMIEIWMSDLCFEESAEKNCDSLISRALSISPRDPEVRLALASIRMSQSRFEEAKAVVVSLYEDMEGREPFDPILPALPARLSLSRLLLEHHLHLEALDILSTIREEDSLNVEGAYLEGWALYLRAEYLRENPAAAVQANPTVKKQLEGKEQAAAQEDQEEETPMTPEECLSEAMRSLMECAKLYADQDYIDEGIGGHVAELLEELTKMGVEPAVPEEEDEDEDGDVAMA